MADTQYEVIKAKDGEIFKVGKITIKVLHTPGHTPESSCYLLLDENGKEHAVFTGDTLFVGDVGRPDLLDGVMSSEELASMLYDSLNNKIKVLGDDVIVYPAHGPGSACGKSIGKETFSTIGEQKKFNYALKDQTRESFIAQVCEGITPPPKYFFEDARINKEGYNPIDEVMITNSKTLSWSELEDEIKRGAILLDTRKSNDFEKGFIPASINIGLNGQFAVWVGTLLDIDKPLVIVAEPGKEDETVLRLARVGYENVKGVLENSVNGYPGELEQIKSISAFEMNDRLDKGVQILDVRKVSEWNVSHLKGATFLSLSDFPKKLEELDKEQPYLVHCGGGYRSMTAISIMKNHGFKNLTNISGGFNSMVTAGLPVISEEVTV
jgi:rhodanese-related sulfurtransferase